jgi:hypothetical protein
MKNNMLFHLAANLADGSDHRKKHLLFNLILEYWLDFIFILRLRKVVFSQELILIRQRFGINIEERH